MNKYSYSAKVVLRIDRVKADGSVAIYWSVRYGALTTRIPTGKTVDPANWNSKEGCPKRNNKHNQLLATYLSGKISEWYTYMLQLETMGSPMSLTIAANFFKGDTKVTLLGFWDEQVRLWQNDKEENTLKSYRSTLNMLKLFNPRLSFGDLTLDTIQKFDLFMANERGNSVGGRFTKHKCLKSIINQCIMKGYMKENPYRFYKIKSSTTTRAFLSIDEVKTLMALELPEKEIMLQKTRDYFVFSCLCGLRYSDVMKLKFGDIKTDPDAIVLTMTKTKKDVLIPLVAPAKAIIEKYTKLTIKTSATNVFPYVDNQVLNRNLKELMKSSGIKQHLTFHTARHTFASCHVQLGTHLTHLQSLLGHAKIAQTQVYAKSQTADLFCTMNKMEGVYDLNKAI